MSKVKTFPVDEKGNMLEYDGCLYGATKYSEKEIVEFTDAMQFKYYTKGRSSLRFTLEDSKGNEWSMMAQCIDDFVKRSVNGWVLGKWIMW